MWLEVIGPSHNKKRSPHHCSIKSPLRSSCRGTFTDRPHTQTLVELCNYCIISGGGNAQDFEIGKGRQGSFIR